MGTYFLFISNIQYYYTEFHKGKLMHVPYSYVILWYWMIR